MDDRTLSTPADRRADIDGKMVRIQALLQEVECEGLLLLEPENFSWLTAGALHRNLPDPGSSPAVYCNGEQRWLLASNTDSQRLFDEELDGLGFQLKEWPWHWGREQLLTDLCTNRQVACDRPLGECKVVGEKVRLLRRQMTEYEQACLKVLGPVLAHALEATCRSFSQNDTERDVAGQISHRLLYRGVQPVHIGVAADGRSRLYRNFSFTSMPIRQHAVLTATGRKYGLCVTASRSVSFGPLDADLQAGQNAVCRVSASYLASTWPDAVPREILLAGRRIYQISGYEHEWMLAPQGYVTGRVPVDLLFGPQASELFQPGWAIVWTVTAGAAASCDTFLITPQGPKVMTPVDSWPLKRIRIQGNEFIRPDILIRDKADSAQT
jgi:hypothetical protein